MRISDSARCYKIHSVPDLLISTLCRLAGAPALRYFFCLKAAAGAHHLTHRLPGPSTALRAIAAKRAGPSVSHTACFTISKAAGETATIRMLAYANAVQGYIITQHQTQGRWRKTRRSGLLSHTIQNRNHLSQLQQLRRRHLPVCGCE